MTRFNAQSLLFALILLFSVIIGSSETDGFKAPTVSPVIATSLVAETLVNQSAPPPAHVPVKSEATETKIETPVPVEPKSRIIIYAQPEEIPPLTKPPQVQAAAALVKEIGSYQNLFEKNILRRWPIASLTKLMTAAVALEVLPPEGKITLTDSAIAVEGEAGNFGSGEIFTVSDLLKAALLSSSNDAVFAIAQSYGFSEFLDRMRATAFNLGMVESTFFDPAGLSVLNQSTGRDLEKVVNHILKTQPIIFQISAEPSALIAELTLETPRTIFNINQFAGRPGFLGGKTGYIDEASGNLISLWRIGSREFLIIVLGSSDRFGETELLLSWLKSNLTND